MCYYIKKFEVIYQKPLSSFTPVSKSLYPLSSPISSLAEDCNSISKATASSDESLKIDDLNEKHLSKGWLVFFGSAILVSVPVFFEAPLVRALPVVSLLCTLGWLGLSLKLRSQPKTQLWGDLLLGFTWTWLAGSIYWGWLRWEPLLHLPIEAIGLPFVGLALVRRQEKVGNWFYLGSLFGTAITDIYFYLVNLIPHWRQIMQVELDATHPILEDALNRIQTPWGIGCAVVLISVLLFGGILPLKSKQLHWWAFSGAVLSTILVDGLFWVAANLA